MARTQAERAAFSKSLQRCVQNQSFLDTFYSIFMDRSAEVREKFKNTDFGNQKLILRASLYILETAADSDSPVPALEALAVKHDKHHYDIKPELYDIWLASMLMAVKEIDPLFSPEIESAWRKTMTPGIKVMTAKYKESL